MTPTSFEETYPRYPFAELVRMSVALSRTVVRGRTARTAAASKALPA